jgi:hypothetical protein
MIEIGLGAFVAFKLLTYVIAIIFACALFD